MVENLKEENERLRGENEQLSNELASLRANVQAAYFEPKTKLAGERETAVAENKRLRAIQAKVIELCRRDLETADARQDELDRLQRLSTNTAKMIESLEGVVDRYFLTDGSDAIDWHERRRGMHVALMDISIFLSRHGGWPKAALPISQLEDALLDTALGLQHPLVAPDKSKRARMGRPNTTSENRLRVYASALVTAMIEAGETKKCALDAAAGRYFLNRLTL